MEYDTGARENERTVRGQREAPAAYEYERASERAARAAAPSVSTPAPFKLHSSDQPDHQYALSDAYTAGYAGEPPPSRLHGGGAQPSRAAPPAGRRASLVRPQRMEYS